MNMQKMKRTNIPDGFEDTGIRKGGHVMIRCTKNVLVDDTYVQCIFTTRNCKDPPNHICHGVIKTPVEEQRIDIKKKKVLIYHDAPLKRVLSIFCEYCPFFAIQEPKFHI